MEKEGKRVKMTPFPDENGGGYEEEGTCCMPSFRYDVYRFSNKWSVFNIHCEDTATHLYRNDIEKYMVPGFKNLWYLIPMGQNRVPSTPLPEN